MGLLSILKKIKRKERDVRVLVLGLDNSGKTTITKKMVGQPIEGVAPTLGFNIATVLHNDLRFNLWDIGGQRSLRSYWRNYFEHTDAIVWVVDAGALDTRLEEAREELARVAADERLLGASLLVLANKADLHRPDPRALQHLVEPFLSSHNCRIQVSSAVTGEGLQEALDWLATDIRSRVFFFD